MQENHRPGNTVTVLCNTTPQFSKSTMVLVSVTPSCWSSVCKYSGEAMFWSQALASVVWL